MASSDEVVDADVDMSDDECSTASEFMDDLNLAFSSEDEDQLQNDAAIAAILQEEEKEVDGYVGSATLMALPLELMEQLCFRLSNPADRYSLRGVARPLKAAVDGSWIDLHSLQLIFAPHSSPCSSVRSVCLAQLDGAVGGSLTLQPAEKKAAIPNDSRTVGVVGSMVDPDTGAERSFSQRIRSAKLDAFLKWIGPRLPSLTLKTEYNEDADSSKWKPDGRQIGRILSLCADANIAPSVVDVRVNSCLLLFDRSLLEALLRWAQFRSDDVSVWRSLTLLAPGQRSLNNIRRLEHGLIQRLTTKYGQPPNDIHLPPPFVAAVADDAASATTMTIEQMDVLLSTVHHPLPMTGDSRAAQWRIGMRNIELWKRKEEVGGDWHISLLQMLLNECHQLKRIDVDDMLKPLGLRPSSLVYPKMLTELVCDRLGEVNGDMGAIVKNCPLLERISLSCSSIAPNDIEELTKLVRLEAIQLKRVDSPLAFTFAAFGIASASQLGAAMMRRPWPMLQSIGVSSTSPHIATLLSALMHGCPLLTDFTLSLSWSALSTDVCLLLSSATEQLCRLPRLRRLNIEWKANGALFFDDRCIDNLAIHCPNLQQLSVTHCQLNPVSLPRLLRECPRLSSLSLLNVDVNLSSLDVLIMVRSAAADVGDRIRRLHINVRSIVGGSYDSLARIVDGLPRDVRLCLSDFAGVCLHGVSCCSCCCFDDDRTKRRSLVLGHTHNLPSAIIVFTCPMPT